MKKICVLFLSLLLLTGCSFVKVVNKDINNIINDTLSKNIDLCNHVSNGYKFYAPRGLKVNEKNDSNIILTDNNNTYYMYIDKVAYYYKTPNEFEPYNDLYLSKKLSFNGKLGYINIFEKDEKYFIEYMYNYAKIEAYVEKYYLNNAIINISYILNSIQYNDSVIDTLLGENALDYNEEKVDIFTSKREDGNFLEYIEQFDNNYLDDNDDLKYNIDE